MPKYLFSKPAGPSKRRWCNTHSGPDGPVICEGCGTNLPKIASGDESYSRSRLFGHYIIDECCGAALDTIYEESGEEMATHFLEDYVKQPFDSRFGVYKLTLARCLKSLKDNAQKVVNETTELVSNLQSGDRNAFP